MVYTCKEGGFEDSGHVAHMRKDPERYWRLIKEVWAAACKAGD